MELPTLAKKALKCLFFFFCAIKSSQRAAAPSKIQSDGGCRRSALGCGRAVPGQCVRGSACGSSSFRQLPWTPCSMGWRREAPRRPPPAAAGPLASCSFGLALRTGRPGPGIAACGSSRGLSRSEVVTLCQTAGTGECNPHTPCCRRRWRLVTPVAAPRDTWGSERC